MRWACYGGSRETVEIRLAAGADLSLRDARYHCTPRAFGICVAASWKPDRSAGAVLGLRAPAAALSIQDAAVFDDLPEPR